MPTVSPAAQAGRVLGLVFALAPLSDDRGKGSSLSGRPRGQGRMQFAFISTLDGADGRISWLMAERGAGLSFLT